MVYAHIWKLESLKKRSKVKDLPLYMRSLARRLESGARNFADDEVRFLEEYYRIIIDDKRPSKKDTIIGFIALLYLWARYGFDYVLDLIEALHLLTGALTDLVERNDSNYRALLQDLLAGADGSAKELTSEEIDAIFREVESSLY